MIGTCQKGLDKARHFSWVARAVGVHHHNDITSNRRKAGLQRRPFAAPAFCVDDTNGWQQLVGDLYSLIGRMIINKDYLVNPMGDMWQHILQVLRFVMGRNYDAYPSVSMF